MKKSPSADRLLPRIFILRDQHVVLDNDLAAIYSVMTGNFNKAVKRQATRFPKDFAFQLTPQELANLKLQTGISRSHGDIILA